MSKRIVLLQALTTMPHDLSLILSGVTAETAVRPGPDGCTIVDVLHYLLAVETQMRANLQQTIAEDRPALPSLPDGPTPESTAVSLKSLLAQIKEARANTIDFLQSVSAGGWQRNAEDSVLGATKFRYLVQRLVTHDTEYLNHLIQLQQQIKNNSSRNPQPALSSHKRRAQTESG